jgi:hypothetical protein
MKNDGKIQLGNSFFDYHGHDLTQGSSTAFASKAAFTLAMFFCENVSNSVSDYVSWQPWAM